MSPLDTSISSLLGEEPSPLEHNQEGWMKYCDSQVFPVFPSKGDKQFSVFAVA
jgi:hypothetical protein